MFVGMVSPASMITHLLAERSLQCGRVDTSQLCWQAALRPRKHLLHLLLEPGHQLLLQPGGDAVCRGLQQRVVGQTASGRGGCIRGATVSAPGHPGIRRDAETHLQLLDLGRPCTLGGAWLGRG